MNNAGMSLIEIVIAMFILSAVTVTILSILVYSIRLNSRSRTRQQTTAAAQTVMENFKAYSVEDICEQFIGVSDKEFQVSGSGVTTEIIWVSSSGERSPNSEDDITEMLSSGDDLNFQIHNMEYQNEHYDVEIELKGHTDMETLVYENRTAENSAAYVSDINMDTKALSQIAENVASLWTVAEGVATPPGLEDPSTSTIIHTSSEVDLKQLNIKRVITVTIKKGTDGTNDTCVAEVGCVYYYGDVDYVYDTETGESETFHIDLTDYTFDLDESRSEDTKQIFKQTIPPGEVGVPLKNLTIYYYPAYKDQSQIQSDEIKIINNLPDQPEIKCYIYKQRNLAISDVKVSTSEQHYDLKLSLDPNVNIYDDNLDTVLGSPSSAHSNSDPVSISGEPSSPHGERYNGISYAAKKDNIDYNDFSQKTVKNQHLMYDVIISIYGHEDSDSMKWSNRLSVLEGTIIDRKR